MLRVSSADVVQMEDARFSDVLSDLNRRQQTTSRLAILGWSAAAFCLIATLSAGYVGVIIGLLVVTAAIGVGVWLDSFQRSSVLMYDFDEETRLNYEEATKAFDALSSCAGKWHIDAGGVIQDIHTWKRNAGAAHLVDKRPTEFSYSLPRVVKSNITPPSIKVGKEILYFLPDFLLVVHDAKVGAAGYDDLMIRWEDSNFIENGAVPSDTRILNHTWKHPNKNGGPDRRFADNRQIPVCQYESIYLSSPNGLNELLQVSRNGVTAPFGRALKRLSDGYGREYKAQNLPRLS